jgi:hypothetical protein
MALVLARALSVQEPVLRERVSELGGAAAQSL